jgi:V8-like Glu-specific endopeptidase
MAAGDARRDLRHFFAPARRRRPTTTGLLVFGVALLVVGASAQQQQYDCAAGCPLSSEAVCGDDGLVYAGECLAFCGGARVVACAGGGGGGGSGGVLKARSSPASPSSPSLGRLLDLSSSSEFALKRGGGASASASASAASSSSGALNSGAVGTAPAAFSRNDLQRYAGEGFALLGPARFDAFKPQMLTVVKRGGDGSQDEDEEGESSSSQPDDVRALRVASDTGLLYATQRSVVGGSGGSSSNNDADVAAMAAMLAGGGSRPKGWRPARTRAGRAAGSSSSPPSSSNSSSTKTAAPAAAAGAAVPMGPGMNVAAWLEITSATDAKTYPYSAVASISVNGWGCSGTRISKWSVLTAGHCVYDFDRGRLQKTTGIRVTMARYMTPNGRLTSPYKSSSVKSYTYFKDFAKGRSFDRIGGLDVAVLELATDPGNTGTLGLESREAACGLAKCPAVPDGGGGVGASTPSPNTSPPTCPADSTCVTPLDSAAYPGDSQVFGQMFRYRAQSAGRATLDEDAQDGVVSSACFTPDSVSQPVLPRIEPGMSGSGLWTVGGTVSAPVYRIVGVLSGLEVDSTTPTNSDDPLTCSGVFGYTEVTKKVFAMVTKAAAGYDKAKGKATGQKGV